MGSPHLQTLHQNNHADEDTDFQRICAKMIFNAREDEDPDAPPPHALTIELNAETIYFKGAV